MRCLLLNLTLLLTTHSAWANLDMLEQRAESGDQQAQLQLAQNYEHGEGVSRNGPKAVQWYCRAAVQGDVEAAYGLAWMHMHGRGVQRNDAIALRWFKKAADSGDTHAKRSMRFLQAQAYQDAFVCPQPVVVAEAVIAPTWKNRCKRRICAQILTAVETLAPEYDLDPNLVLAVIMVESHFNPKAKSPKNAQGLMQLIPGTARRFGVRNAWRVDDNIRGGMAYLKWLLAYYQGDVKLVAAAYNAGEGAVDRYKGIPRYKETQQYVKKILHLYGKQTHKFQKNWISASPAFKQDS